MSDVKKGKKCSCRKQDYGPPHYFHKECINSWKKYDRQAKCPSCRKKMEYRLDDNLWPMGAAYTQARTGEFMISSRMWERSYRRRRSKGEI